MENHQHCSTAASLPQKQKRTSVARSSQSSAGHPEELDQFPALSGCTTDQWRSTKRIYHEVVDDMLRYKNGQLRQWSIVLGRPDFTALFSDDGHVAVDQCFGVGVHPPCPTVNISGEPQPSNQPWKRTKK
ncbi:hypothetical protein E3U43_002150 [Larimichthys crocea]|uniref:Uncharacterized protein n=1 Tax=Larimichthys crocea TaxID=215358 RepID=A0ACD3QQJ9_LARCR|nr:hypothetical protein E3U43_002150 [Larimichthys crocea]